MQAQVTQSCCRASIHIWEAWQFLETWCLRTLNDFYWTAMYRWGKQHRVNKEASAANEIIIFSFHLVNTQIHCQPREKSWHTWGALLMNQKKIYKKFGYMQISKDSAVSLHHLFITRSITKQHHIICHITIKRQRGTSFQKKKSCLLSLVATHFSAQYNA